MIDEKINVNADLVLQTLAEFESPQKLKWIADATGSPNIKQLEKYQVRAAVDDHLLEADLIERYEREEKRGTAYYYALTDAGRARVESSRCDCESRIRQLEKQVSELEDNQTTIIDNIETLDEIVNETIYEAHRRVKADLEAIQEYLEIHLPHTTTLD